MEWTFAFNREQGILEVAVKGEMTPPELNAMARENLAEIKKHDCFKCLLDYRQAYRNLGVLDAYNRPKDISKIGVDRNYRIAILVPEAEYPKYAFQENVYKNSSYDLEIFTNREAALAFLSK